MEVHFNPTTLVYTVENSVSQQSGAADKAQYAGTFTGKLTMDLQFDTTDTGADVRTVTKKVAMMMTPTNQASGASANQASPPGNNTATQSAPAQAPPMVVFAWGSYQFRGVLESYKETIDFFSADGVALRSLVAVGLAQQNLVFDDGVPLKSATTSGTLVPSGSGDSALSIATRGGDPAAARQLATANGLDSVRFTGGATLQVGGGVQLNPPAAFVSSASAGGGLTLGLGLSASGGVGASVGVSEGISGGAGAGISASAGIGISAGAHASASLSGGAVFGGTASAGMPATAGAFAGLETGRATVSTTARLNPSQIIPVTVGSDVSTFAGASFDLGGAANNVGAGGLSADVGTQFSFSARLAFDQDD